MKTPRNPMEICKDQIPEFKLNNLENATIEKFAHDVFTTLTTFYPEVFPRTSTEYRMSYENPVVDKLGEITVCGAADSVSNIMWLFVNKLHEGIEKRKNIFPESLNSKVDSGLMTANDLYSGFIVENVIHELFHINQYQPNIYDSNKRFHHYTRIYEGAVEFETLLFLIREEEFLNYAFRYKSIVDDDLIEMVDIYKDEMFARFVRIAVEDKWTATTFKDAKECADAYLRKIGLRGFLKFLCLTGKLNIKYVKYKQLSIETDAAHFLLNSHPNLRDLIYTNTDLKNARKLIRDLVEFDFGYIRKQRSVKKYQYVKGVEIQHVTR